VRSSRRFRDIPRRMLALHVRAHPRWQPARARNLCCRNRQLPPLWAFACADPGFGCDGCGPKGSSPAAASSNRHDFSRLSCRPAVGAAGALCRRAEPSGKPLWHPTCSG
jgi:hypothetical protein